MITAICHEITNRKQYLQNQKIDTLYFGGGTPSLLTHADIQKIVDAVNATFDIEKLREFTFEMNPDDVTPALLSNLQQVGVTRLSMGVQSFKASDLKFMHRAHNVSEAEYAIKAAQDAGFENMSIDLIYGTPGLTDEQWIDNLQKTIQYNIPHISAYALTVEERTLLAKQISRGEVKRPASDQAAKQFEIMLEVLSENGYEHYEISNFAKPGQYALHNTSYWQGVPYIGIGPSAHSYNEKSRQWNVANNALYLQGVLKNNATETIEMLTANQRMNEYIMTSLRTMWGLNLKYVEEKFGTAYATTLFNNINPFVMKGQVLVSEDKYFLSSEGKLFADSIASDLFF